MLRGLQPSRDYRERSARNQKRQKRQAQSKSFATIEACADLAPVPPWRKSAAVPSAAFAFSPRSYFRRHGTYRPLANRQKRHAHSKSYATPSHSLGDFSAAPKSVPVV